MPAPTAAPAITHHRAVRKDVAVAPSAKRRTLPSQPTSPPITAYAASRLVDGDRSPRPGNADGAWAAGGVVSGGALTTGSALTCGRSISTAERMDGLAACSSRPV